MNYRGTQKFLLKTMSYCNSNLSPYFEHECYRKKNRFDIKIEQKSI